MTSDQMPSETARQTFVLKPQQSLGLRTFFVLLMVYGGVSFLTGLFFLSLGAWPVLGFCLLDVVLLGIAFRSITNQNRQIETIEILNAQLELTSHDPRGREIFRSFNAYWLRVVLAELPGGGSELRLVSTGKPRVFVDTKPVASGELVAQRNVVIGRLLSDPERRELAVTLRVALAEWTL